MPPTFATLPLSTAASTVGLDSGCVVQAHMSFKLAHHLELTAVPPEQDTNMEKEPIGPTLLPLLL